MRRVILAIVCTAAGLALLLSFKTRNPTGLASATAPPQDQNGTSASPSATTGAAGTGPGASGGKSASGAKTTAAAKTVAGDVTQTIYGPIEVKITVKGGRITAVSVPVYPDGTVRDMQINAFALPELVQQTIAADSARLDAVSGATYTSQGYIRSLQSAIDKAGL
jgi:uncharacterized protein with FMN-binding domain